MLIQPYYNTHYHNSPTLSLFSSSLIHPSQCSLYITSQTTSLVLHLPPPSSSTKTLVTVTQSAQTCRKTPPFGIESDPQPVKTATIPPAFTRSSTNTPFSPSTRSIVFTTLSNELLAPFSCVNLASAKLALRPRSKTVNVSMARETGRMWRARDGVSSGQDFKE